MCVRDVLGERRLRAARLENTLRAVDAAFVEVEDALTVAAATREREG